MALVHGAFVGPYRTLDLLGRGGMGEVYRARDERLGRDVAIKILPPAYAADADRLRRFDQEARAAAALNHPNILAVFDTGTHDGAPYIVSELLHGQTLRDLLGGGALVIRRAVDYAIAIATGLAAAHGKGIIHRDIKPENVFVTDDGRVKILDFGLAKLREPLTGSGDTTARVGETTGSVILGTAGYMSPEQVRGQQPDHRSDIFSLGATLYEMVSGERAFKGDTGVEALSAILKHDPPLLSETREAIPASLASVIQHCLEKERDQRFQSARDLAFALSRLAGTSSSGAVILPAGRSRWRRGMLGAAAAAALVAVGGAAYLVRPREASPLPSFQQLTFRRGHIASARFAPDGQTVISTASWDGQPFEVSSMRLDTAESTPLPLPKGTNVRSVSRSGELAVLIKDDVLARVPIGGAGARDVLDRAYDADWAPDGSLAAVRLDGRRMWLEYPPGKTCYEPRNAVNVVRISPDGALLAVVEQQVMGGGAEWLTILDRGCAVVSRSQKFSSVVQDGLAWTPDGREVWFTASQRAGRGEIHAMTRDGRERTVYRGMGSMRIFDFASDGRALIAHDSFRADMSLIEVGVAGERDLSWREWSRPSAISQDGTLLAFGDLGRNSMDGKSHGYVRRTDGSSAVLLSEFGTPSAISPDGKWALTGAPSNPQLALVPTGVGQSRPLDLGTLEATSGLPNGKVWLADGSRIVLVGNERGKRRRVFIQNVAGGPPQPFTPEGAFGPLVTSPDSTHVIVRNEKGHLSKYPIAGGAPVMVEGAEAGDEPLAWSTRGEAIWVLNRGTVPAKIFRIELASGRRAFWREVPYADPAAIEPESLRVVMAADGSRFVYGYQKHLSDLYVVAGLK